MLTHQWQQPSPITRPRLRFAGTPSPERCRVSPKASGWGRGPDPGAEVGVTRAVSELWHLGQFPGTGRFGKCCRGLTQRGAEGSCKSGGRLSPLYFPAPQPLLFSSCVGENPLFLHPTHLLPSAHAHQDLPNLPLFSLGLCCRRGPWLPGWGWGGECVCVSRGFSFSRMCLRSGLWPCLQTDHLCCHMFVTETRDCHTHGGATCTSLGWDRPSSTRFRTSRARGGQ